MDHKLQEITEKLYQEGVIKGKEEADKIIGEANKQAIEIIEKATKEASLLIASAEKKAEELNRTTKSELQMASQQMITSLQQEIVAFITAKIVDESIRSAIDDKLFIQQLIAKAVEKWVSDQTPTVFVAPSDKAAIDDFFSAKAKHLLDKGITIETAGNIKAGFQIGPADGSYKVSFTREDLIAFFKEFIRPKVVDLLFEDK